MLFVAPPLQLLKAKTFLLFFVVLLSVAVSNAVSVTVSNAVSVTVSNAVSVTVSNAVSVHYIVQIVVY